MQSAAFWLSVVVAVAMLIPSRTRNAGYFAVAGTALGLFLHFDIATIPEVRNVALMLWAVALLLFVDKMRAGKQRRIA